MDSKIQIMLVDDEAAVHQRIFALLTEYPDFRICADAYSLQEAKKVLDSAATAPIPKPDVLFLDVELADGDGFSLAAYVREKYPHIAMVFVTGHVEWAIRGYDYESLDYLVKPIEKARFARTLQRIKKHAAAMQNRPEGSTEITLETAAGLFMLSVEEILYLELRGRKIYVIRKNGEEICCSSTIHKMEKQLKPYGFAKIYQSVIVQKAEIACVEKEEQGQTYHVILKSNQAKLPASRRFYYEMMEKQKQ